MNDTHLCSMCGKKLDGSMRTCPDCGTLNPYNSVVITESVSRMIYERKAAKKFSKGFLIFALIIGCVLFILHFAAMLSNSFGAIVGIISAGMVVAASIIGMVKDEEVAKLILISGAVSFWMLLMHFLFSY